MKKSLPYMDFKKCCHKFRSLLLGVSVPSKSTIHWLVDKFQTGTLSIMAQQWTWCVLSEETLDYNAVYVEDSWWKSLFCEAVWRGEANQLLTCVTDEIN